MCNGMAGGQRALSLSLTHSLSAAAAADDDDDDAAAAAAAAAAGGQGAVSVRGGVARSG